MTPLHVLAWRRLRALTARPNPYLAPWRDRTPGDVRR